MKNPLIPSVIVLVALHFYLSTAARVDSSTCSTRRHGQKGACGPATKICSPGGGEWKCEGIKFADETFAAIHEGHCQKLEKGYLQCGNTVVSQRSHKAASTGHCVRTCKQTGKGPHCKCTTCNRDRIVCGYNDDTTTMDADQYFFLHSSYCQVQRVFGRSRVLCWSPSGELRTTVGAYLKAVAGTCSYECDQNLSVESCGGAASKEEGSNEETTEEDQDLAIEEQKIQKDPSQIVDEDEQNGGIGEGYVAVNETDTTEPHKQGDERAASPTGVVETSYMIPASDVEGNVDDDEVDLEGDIPVNNLEDRKEGVATAPEPMEKTVNEEISQPGGVEQEIHEANDTATPPPHSPTYRSEEPPIIKVASPPPFDVSLVAYTPGPWSSCSATCGMGVRTRVISCTVQGSLQFTVPQEVCEEELGDPPTNIETCTMPPCEVFTPYVVGGAECSGTCGVGVTTRSLLCRSSMGTTVSLAKCGLAVAQITEDFWESVSIDTTLPQEALGLPQGSCNHDAGISARKFFELSNSSAIYDPEKYEVTHCKNSLQVSGVLQGKCDVGSCSQFIWKAVSEWSQCSESCGGGSQTRQVVCFGDNGQAGDELCPSPRPATTRSCNTASCARDMYAWRVGNWSECDKECFMVNEETQEVDYGYTHRIISCVGHNGEIVEDGMCAMEVKPESEMICTDTVCDFCGAENACSRHGSCHESQCACETGYGGKRCEFKIEGCTIGAGDLECCPSTVVDASGRCCLSGQVDVQGSCCELNEHLDANGSCCSGEMDACGICGGPAVDVDAFGQCCPTTLDASGECCASGMVDECGVCDGDGSSCDTVLHVAVSVQEEVFKEVQTSAHGTQSDQLQQHVTLELSTQLNVQSSHIHVTRIQGQSHSLSDSNIFNLRQPKIGNRKVKEKLGIATKSRKVLQVSDGTASPAQSTLFEVILEVLIDGAARLSTSRAINALTRIKAYYDNALDTAPNNRTIILVSEEKRGICGNGVCELGERSTSHDDTETCSSDCGAQVHMPPFTVVNGESMFCGGKGRSILSTGTCQCYAGYAGEACDRCMSGYMNVNELKKGPISCVKDFSPQNPGNHQDTRPDGTSTDLRKEVNETVTASPSPVVITSPATNELPTSPSTGDLPPSVPSPVTGNSAQAGPPKVAIIAAGVVVGLVIIGVIIIFFVRRAKAKRPPEPPSRYSSEDSGGSPISPTIPPMTFTGLPDERKKTDDSADNLPVEPHLIVNAVSVGEAASKYTSSLDSILENDDDEGPETQWPQVTFIPDEDSILDSMERGEIS